MHQSTMKTDKKEVEKSKEPDFKPGLFSSRDEQIDYMFGDDPILCQALKNCYEEE